MTDEYLEHHKLLVTAISYLSYSSISQKMISVALTSIKIYCSRFNDLHYLTHTTCNIHCLYHLPDAVRKFGPMPMTSCFSYEDLNGSFGRLVQGTRYSQLQICSALCTFNNIIELKSNIVENYNVTQFRTKLELFNLRRRKLTYISDKFFVIGKIIKIELSETLKTIFDRSNVNLPAFLNAFKFYRLFKNYIAYESLGYKRKKKTNSTVVIYNYKNKQRIGIINEFIKICYCRESSYQINCESSIFFAIITDCISVRSIIPDFLIDMIDLCIRSNEPPLAINMNELLNLCFCIENSDENEPNTFYVVRPVNQIEID